MTGRALLGGAAILAAVTLWHRTPDADPMSSDGRSACERAGAGVLCDAASGLSRSIRSSALIATSATRLPPPETPGAVDPFISQTNIDATICRPGYARSVRPAYAITGPLKRRLMDAEHPGEPMADYELDHLNPISLGGAPRDRRDIWLQPRRGQANAGDKNVLAYVLWRLVCDHRVPLATAQAAIRHDWTQAYQTYATPANITRYHYRHRDAEGN